MEAHKEDINICRVLVAEDSPTQRQIIKMVLKNEGLDVIMASDGIEAVTQALQESPDLVVLDIEMPKMNGYQVCRLLKDDQRTSHIPIIILTSRAQETDKYWGLKTGADCYVTKDFKLTGLAGAVGEMMEKAQKSGGYKVCRRSSVETQKHGEMDVDVLSRVNDLLDRKLYEATIINEISRLNTLSEDCSVAISSILTVIGKVTDCFVCSVFLIEEEQLVVHVHNPVGAVYLEKVKEKAIEAATPFLRKFCSKAQIKVFLDADPKFVKEEHPEFDAINSMLTIPLKARGHMIAMLVLSSPRPDAFNEEIRRILDIVEFPISLVVDNARLHEGTRKMAITDGLTKLFNHRYFYELLEKEFLRAKRYKSMLSLIMVDIDSFKLVNDTHGHQVGDEVLTELACVIRHEVRDVDMTARYGGEEFAILLPETSLEKAEAVAERIRSNVETHDFGIPSGEKVTVSLGVAGYPDCDAQTQNELVQVADEALYAAKESGKNKVVLGGMDG